MTNEELKQKRRAILMTYMNKPEVIVELKEIKEYLMVLSTRELKYNPDLRLVKAIDKLSQLLKKIPEIEENIRPIVKVSSPDKIKLDWEGIPDNIKPKDKIKIDWDAGREKLTPLFNFKSPLVWLHKQLEEFLSPFFNRIISLISEPDRTEIIRDNSGNIEIINDYYGIRKVSYKFLRNNSEEIKEIQRNER